jgi:peptidoglycan/xylan/chitin deacetylase (PgdA/CDA1 family)
MIQRWLFFFLSCALFGCVGTQSPAKLDAAPASAPVSQAAGLRVAVTVDDLPVHGPSYPGLDRVELARHMIAVLQKHRVPGVYGFVNGKKVEDDPSSAEVLRVWRKAGYPLANHGWSHRSLNDTPVEEYTREVSHNQEFLTQFLGEPAPKWYRYPFLQEGATQEARLAVRAWLSAEGYRVAPVTLDFDDWAWNAPFARCSARGDAAQLDALRASYLAAIRDELRVTQEMQRTLFGKIPPQVLLLHIGAMDADQLDALLSLLESEGARFVTLEEAQRDEVFALDAGVAWKAGPSEQYRHWKAKRLADPSWPAPPRAARDLDALEKVCAE